MKYTLMHKDHKVLDMDIELGNVIWAGEIFDRERIPVGITADSGRLLHGLSAWWSHRSIPLSRSGIDRALAAMNAVTPQVLLAKSMGLSLSDAYWIRPENSDISWEKVNFFDNIFSEDMGNILFGEKPPREAVDIMSPDCSSDGWLRKKWVIRDGKRCLVKGGSNFFQEPFNEVIATMAAERLGIRHVSYTIDFEGARLSPVCVCEAFTDSCTELIPAGAVNRILPFTENESKYDHFVRCCKVLDIPHITESLDEMLTLDYMIANQDRHMGNFGVLRNADTLEYTGFAPLYDCGTSLRYDTPTVYIDEELNVEALPFESFHDGQIRLVSEPRKFDPDRLYGIEAEISELFSDKRAAAYIDKSRQDKIIGVIAARISRFRKIYDEAAGK